MGAVCAVAEAERGEGCWAWYGPSRTPAHRAALLVPVRALRHSHVRVNP